MTIIRKISKKDEIPDIKQTAFRVFLVGFVTTSMAIAYFIPGYVNAFSELLFPLADRGVDISENIDKKGSGQSFETSPMETLTLRAEQAREENLAEEEILWLARTLYSETKISWEQRLVAWVIRNRVISLYYPDTYKKVVLDPKQFSGLNDTDPNFWSNISLDKDEKHPAWQSALAIAEEVYYAEDDERILSADVMHFYSPHAVSKHPKWAEGSPVHVIESADGSYTRFAFYANVK